MTGRVLWLPAVLHARGVEVISWPGWETRGAPIMDSRAVVCHHTAGKTSPENDVRLCIEGRADVSGPLCHIVLDRQGRAHVIASGKANHAGDGSWRDAAGNANAIGIEGANDGVGERWPKAQADAYLAVCAAIVEHLGLPADAVCSHHEWAPGRKIDPAGPVELYPWGPGTWDMNLFRADVAQLLEADVPLTIEEYGKIGEIVAKEVNKALDERLRDDVAAAVERVWDDPTHKSGAWLTRWRVKRLAEKAGVG